MDLMHKAVGAGLWEGSGTSLLVSCAYELSNSSLVGLESEIRAACAAQRGAEGSKGLKLWSASRLDSLGLRVSSLLESGASLSWASLV